MHQVRTGVGLLVAAASSCTVALALFASPAAADPGQPVITAAPASPGNDTSPTWEFGLDGGGPLSCRLAGPGGFEAPYAACLDSMTYDLAGRPDGTYTFSVRRQPAPSSSQEQPPTTRTYVLDTAARVTITSAPPSPSDRSVVSWSFTAEPGATFDCALGSVGRPAPPPTACTSGQNFTLTDDGTYTFHVQATDRLGNTGPPATSTYTLDRVAPEAPVIGRGPASPGSDTTLEWTFTSEKGSTTECSFGPEGAVQATWEECSGSKSYQILDYATAGSYLFSVRSTDAAGNTSPTSTSVYDFQPVAEEAPVPAGGTPVADAADPEPDTTAGEAAPAGGGPKADSKDLVPADSGKETKAPPGGPVADTTDPAPSGIVEPKIPPGQARKAAAAPLPLPNPTPTGTAAPLPAAPSATSPVGPAASDESETVSRSSAVALSPTPGLSPTPNRRAAAIPVQGTDKDARLEGPSELNAADGSDTLPSLLPDPGGTSVAETLLEAGAATVKRSAFPFLLLVMVLLFLLVQDRIDRRDPKLALAPVYRHPDLGFMPPPSRHQPPHD